MGNGALAIGPKLPRPSSTLPKWSVLLKNLLRSMLRLVPIVLATGQAQSRRRDPNAAGGRGGEQNAQAPSRFAFPSESADDFLTLIDAHGADLFSGSDAQPVTF